ncbi:methylenetetrahydromethanopterin reductase [Quadrisphaera granulorum]|uniref:Methylenetetrahydromethanopterin reductase n=1 Tax=Quadrisphaera granulorum TaxID=317664 RepID=A0A316A5B8_9ACTN|nr:TIGR03842 family LLM class F420-dependent oxidoreductase [Quadrisphaera granulorum]PWJ52885.1 methylenetetrahydromethanopterin reductase [Quadrisphaera granulorum]SZE97267.1 methylenetetrahydromethanopterin reductase [Quadrisphaera granulorum]
MDVGVVFQTDPPARAVVAASVRAEQAGFSHAWTFDSHVLWQEPYVIHATILEATERIVVGPMVTNPATRDTTVTASTFATLAEMHGNRVVCGIGRGDSAVRTLKGQPVTLAGLRESVETIRTLTGGGSVLRGQGEHAASVSFPWVPEGTPPVEVWVAAYGPKALQLTGEVADGFILQLADPTIAAWTITKVREAAEAAGRDPASIRFCVAAPAYVTDGSAAQLAHAREQTRWFGGMVGNHVADIVAKYGGDGAGVPRALSDYIAARQGYDYAQHGRAGNTHADFVPDEIVDRFCVLGPPAAQLERLAELAELGCDQFAVYAQHDAKDSVIDAYGTHVVEAANTL